MCLVLTFSFMSVFFLWEAGTCFFYVLLKKLKYNNITSLIVTQEKQRRKWGWSA